MNLRRLVLSLLTILLGIPALPLSAADLQPLGVERFLASRVVLGTVVFDPQSIDLGPSARQETDRLALLVREVGGERFLLRLEGFADSQSRPEQLIPLSLLRAKAVADYLFQTHGLGPELSLTGIGRAKAAGQGGEGRVELVRYDNLWGELGAREETVLTILFQ